MMPLTPPYLIADLTHEHLERRLRHGQPRYRYDPDRFEESAALQPDPIYLGLRHVVSEGPLGRLVHWFEQRAEVREERAWNRRIDAKAKSVERPTLEVLSPSTTDAPDEERTAA